MKKLPVIASLTFLLTFLGLFIYLYRSSGKFRKSIAIALLAALVMFSGSAESTAKEVEGFARPEHSRPARRPGFFSGKSANNGSGTPETPNGGGGDDDDGEKPQYTAPESVQDTKKRVENIDEHILRLEEISDSDTESEFDSAEYPSALTVKEALKLPDVRTYEEAKKYAETNLPKRLSINKQHYISGVMAAKKTPHAPEIGLNPVDYGMKAEHITLIRGMGLYEYLQKGYPLPPYDFIQDYQNLVKDSCLQNQTRMLDDKPYTHNRKTPISIYENQEMSKSGKSLAIFVFDDSPDNGDMITLGKRGHKYMSQVKESGNMGTAGGTI